MFFITASISLGLALLPYVSAGMIHDVQVGADGLTYTPPAISAAAGDQVIFHFHAKNHTVTQSSFANPCGLKEGGFDSGFMPVAANTTDNLPTYTINVPDTTPIWVFCNQAANTPNSHCGAGMVFAVNCGQDGTPNSFTNFVNSAKAIGASLSASAAAASTAGSATATSSGAWTTAAYGGVTIPAAPTGTPVVQTITLSQSTWTTSYTSYPGSPAPTPVSLDGTVHKVVVGGTGQLFFSPSNITAAPRDTIVFEFHVKNHTVTQSSFADPCRPLSVNGQTGFDSGFEPVAADATTFPTWNYTVTDTAPVWAYCKQATHCGAGMVFSVNAVQGSARDFDAFKSVAQQLNGTQLAATAPSASASGNGAAALHLSSVGLAAGTIVLGAALGLVAVF